jgi:hypothetical protein
MLSASCRAFAKLTGRLSHASFYSPTHMSRNKDVILIDMTLVTLLSAHKGLIAGIFHA